MDLKAVVEAMGEEVLATCLAMPRGYGKRIATRGAGRAAAGALGALAGAAVADRARRQVEPVTPGGHEGNIFVVVTAHQVAFFTWKRGIFRSAVGELLVRVPREQVAGCTFEAAPVGASHLQFKIADGTVYALDVARVHRGKAGQVQAMLRG